MKKIAVKWFLNPFLLFLTMQLLFISCQGKEEQAKSAVPAMDTKTPSVSAENPRVIIKTNMGEIEVELFEKLAPLTVKNFLQYVDDNFYDGTIFHRVMSDFMIQGGGMTPDMKEKNTRAPVMNEAGNGVQNSKGSIAMARTSDVNSATAQFFINVKDNHQLNHTGKLDYEFGYCVFGQVVAGMDVVEKIKMVETKDAHPHQNVPVNAVVIESVRRKR